MSKEQDQVVVHVGFGTGKTSLMMQAVLREIARNRRPARLRAGAIVGQALK